MKHEGMEVKLLSFLTSALDGDEFSAICAGRITFRVGAALPIHSVGPGLAVKPVLIFAYARNQTMIVWQSRDLVTISTDHNWNTRKLGFDSGRQ
jgi:hypothetical protein